MSPSNPKGFNHIKMPPDFSSSSVYKSSGGGPKISREYASHGKALRESFFNAWGSDADANIHGRLMRIDVHPDASSSEVFAIDGARKFKVLRVETAEANNSITGVIAYLSPENKEKIVKKLEKYEEKGKEKAMFKAMESLEPADLHSLWVDKKEYPKESEFHTFEVWVDVSNNGDKLHKDLLEYFKDTDSLEPKPTISDHVLRFPGQYIYKVYCRVEDLEKLREELGLDFIASFSYLETASGFFTSLPSSIYQEEWVQSIRKNVEFNPNPTSTVCILDTGIAKEHPLLKDGIKQKGLDVACHDVHEGTMDHKGHGTAMAGLALYGDLAPLLEKTDTIVVNHCIESIRVFPKTGDNEKDSIARIVKDSIAKAEINNSGLNRVTSISWGIDKTDGNLSLTSAIIDMLAFGGTGDTEVGTSKLPRRLFVISAGNTVLSQIRAPQNYLDNNDTTNIDSPGQSWNALTVGSCTDKTYVDDTRYDKHTVLAPKGELSPSSATSVSWTSKDYPIKPDIVMEGGNAAYDSAQFYDNPDDLSLLSTSKKGLLAATGDTSASTALAARLAAMLQHQYPDYRPETIRGLMVHSADWDERLSKLKGEWKKDKRTLLRRYGYGKPDEVKALASSKNKPFLVFESEIRPFKKADSSGVNFNEMGVHNLPWDSTTLEVLGEEIVKLRITLSYFIEPSPSRKIPLKSTYSYQSYGLRFLLKSSDSMKDDFIGKASGSEKSFSGGVHNTEWKLGPDSRNKGTLISDIWEGSANDLAGMNCIAVYPTGGWWKHNKSFPDKNKLRHTQSARYSLIVSIETENEEIDIYTSIESVIESKVAVSQEVEVLPEAVTTI